MKKQIERNFGRSIAGVISLCIMLAIETGGCAGGTHELARFQKAREEMGTFVKVAACHEKEDVAEKAVSDAFTEIERVVGIMSTYDKDSEVSRLNRDEDGTMIVSRELFDILVKSKEISEMSGGAFDITVGPLVMEWRKARNENRAPNEERLKVLRNAVGYEKMSLDPETLTVMFDSPEMEINLGAIAKGYSADMAAAAMHESGVENVLIDAGGDVLARGTREDGTSWSIGLRDPSGGAITVLELNISDMAVTTSGNYEQFIESGGQKYSHIFDPRTGESSDCVSATVIAENAMKADALSTAICVLGPADGISLANSLPDVEAFVIDKNGDAYRSSGFDSFVMKYTNY